MAGLGIPLIHSRLRADEVGTKRILPGSTRVSRVGFGVSPKQSL